MTRTLPALLAAAAAAAALPVHAKPKPEPQLLYFAEGNRLHRLDVDTIGKKGGPRDEVLIQNAGDEGGGGAPLFVSPNRDINGMVCPFPDGSGRFVAGEDTRQPSPPPGWGVFEANGLQIGKLTATYFQPQGEPYGCAFAPDPDPGDDLPPPLFTTEVGEVLGGNGQLILWFPPYDDYPGADGEFPETDAPSTNFCKIAVDIETAGGIALDAQGRVYVASSSGSQILRFSPPFPTAPTPAGGCGGDDGGLGQPLADLVSREVFASTGNGMGFFSGLAIGPNGNLFAASVVAGNIGEYAVDESFDQRFVRLVVEAPEDPLAFPKSLGNPQGIGFDAEGTLYYADLDLQGTFPALDTGPDGRIWRVRFKKGDPLAPETVVQGLAFPDAVTLVAGDLERKKAGGKGRTEWRAYAGGPLRQFFNAREKKLKRSTLPDLRERWRFPTNAIITGSPVVARVEVPGEGAIQVVYFSSWDQNVYAVRLSDGSKLWHFTADAQPGSTYPGAASGLVERVGSGQDAREVLFMPWGEVLYALDAVTGEEIWRFTAGTGCVDDLGLPPGLCAFDGERNQIETSPIAAEGKVFFGMDVNDQELGKGGFYAVDVDDGRMAWFFDLESGSTCTPGASDEVRRFDGYHSEAELGLPAGFLALPGCDFDRTTTGCGNVWSSPALDAERGLLFFGSSNCETDDDAGTPLPGPTLPPYDAGLTALRLDGTPAWRWRPREVDLDDRAFGATPNLFAIQRGRKKVDVVGIGGKDKSYYVIDRDGVNEDTGLGFDPLDPLALPYWSRQLLPQPGFFQGGVIGTPAVDEKARRIYLSTAPGASEFAPDQPTAHALDLDTGAVLWTLGSDAAPQPPSFAPVSATRELVFTGTVIGGRLRMLDAHTGELLDQRSLNSVAGNASGAVVVDGTVLVGAGIGDLQAAPETARAPTSLRAFCVPNSKGCPRD
jgi:outer membrane protein assembly factor BamB